MAVTVTPFLMFQGEAVEAAGVYADLFPEGSFAVVQRDAEDNPLVLRLTVGGQEITLLESPVKHDVAFTPAFSLNVTCDSEAEVDRLFDGLSDGGSVLMPLDSYPFNPRYGWLTDRFGLSWQIGLET